MQHLFLEGVGLRQICDWCRLLYTYRDSINHELLKSRIQRMGLMTEWNKDGAKQIRHKDGDLGGTMRLGAYECVLKPNSKVAQIYGAEKIFERHRHRYEVNIKYKDMLNKAGMSIVGLSPEGELPEIVERPEHPWFIGVQFHPELKSRPFAPHPLFVAFVKAAIDNYDFT